MRATAHYIRDTGRTLRERHLRKFVFIHINKTGGSSVERALGLKLDHSTALEKYRQLGDAAWRRKFRFTVVRNPWDKVVSHYHYRVQTNQTDMAGTPIGFADWVRRSYLEHDPQYYDVPKMFLPQWQWLCDEEGQLLVDFVGRFERLPEDFARICERLGVNASLGHAKKSARGSYQKYYDDKTAQVIADCFKKDIEEFGYRFEH